MIVPMDLVRIEYNKDDEEINERVALQKEFTTFHGSETKWSFVTQTWLYNFSKTVEENIGLCLRMLYISKTFKQERKMAKEFDLLLE
jgi:hypothetical protein